ncbi:YjgN family protein [Thioalkalivibrio sp. HK1]|uniref:YjgN family protein n=1 Tax=Thioalkalivibrio sp. HK1 TaxID=1469245 RepID=UPI0018CC0739|nr:DUF898 family protein [Thioalkalivibrio sp. HK1]
MNDSSHSSHSIDRTEITRGLVPEAATLDPSEGALEETPESDSKAAPTAIPIRFDGSADQYFELYIANTLLTIITLGIYSAWARVRDRRFFMGHTYIGHHNLEFDAQPIDILISRAIIVAISVALISAEIFFDLYWSGIGIFLILTLLLMPIALVRARTFIARHTIHRTVRFRYSLEYRWAVVLFLGYALLIITYSYYPSEGLWSDYFTGFYIAAAIALFLFPLLLHLDHRIQIGQLQFGGLRFFFTSSLKSYYAGWGTLLLATILFTIVLFGVIGMLSDYPLSQFNIEEIGFRYSLGFWFIEAGRWGLVALALYAICIFAIYRSVFACLYWRSFRIGADSAIESTLDWRLYARLLATNYVLIVLTVGLMYPWARVRAYRYVAERLQLRLGPETAAEYSSAGDDLTALAGEFADIGGWDFDFGAT